MVSYCPKWKVAKFWLHKLYSYALFSFGISSPGESHSSMRERIYLKWTQSSASPAKPHYILLALSTSVHFAFLPCFIYMFSLYFPHFLLMRLPHHPEFCFFVSLIDNFAPFHDHLWKCWNLWKYSIAVHICILQICTCDLLYGSIETSMRHSEFIWRNFFVIFRISTHTHQNFLWAKFILRELHLKIRYHVPVNS